MSPLETILQSIGLNAVEAKVYLACLRLGTQDVKMIAKEVGISSSDTVVILTTLADRGFVSKFASAKDFYTPEHPDVIIKILENDKHKMEEGIKKLSRALPKFSEFINPAFSKPEIAFYEGRDGIVAAYEDTLTSKTDILAITSIEDTEKAFPDYVPKYYKRRKAAGILIKAIFTDSPMARKRHAKDADEMRISRLLPKEMMDVHIELNIYDDKVAYFSLQEELAVIVKSQMIADSMTNIFNLCWRMAEAYQNGASQK